MERCIINGLRDTSFMIGEMHNLCLERLIIYGLRDIVYGLSDASFMVGEMRHYFTASGVSKPY
jgi:hypothetical protein